MNASKAKNTKMWLKCRCTRHAARMRPVLNTTIAWRFRQVDQERSYFTAFSQPFSETLKTISP
jgi:hypothetical protein